MRLNIEESVISTSDDYCDVIFRRITELNVDQCFGAYYSVGPMKRLLKEHSDKVDGFMIIDPMTEKCNSYAWVAYPKLNYRHYRINNVESYLFKLSTMPGNRGQGYCGKLIKLISTYLAQERNINSLTLAVMKNNLSAIRAYEKAGFTQVGEKRFVRFLRYNIPYYTL